MAIKRPDMNTDKTYECLWFEDEEIERDDLLFLEELFGASGDSDILIETGLPILHC